MPPMDQAAPLHLLLWERGISAGEHRFQWGLSESLNVFWNNRALPNWGLWGVRAGNLLFLRLFGTSSM